MVPEESAAGRVTRSLRQRLLTGELKPGAPLSQSRIAAEYGVSRMPARDALQVLAAEGLVDLDAFTAVVRGLSITELQELYELREAVEPVLTRIAVPNVGRAEVAQMTTLIEGMESNPPAVDWLAANATFHALVYSRADRARMIELTEQLRRLTDRYVYLHVGVFGDTDHIHEEHRQILHAVRNGDAAGAAELTRLHIATSHEFILRYLLEHEHMPLGHGKGNRATQSR
ncbi:transcriptional regulator, GntR family [Streptosporangium subroseum]|uniref:Transcriptional regulator, GntR family n=1 Tax=Streptosporangium subroseum TaxID=106412 RepID=A0A239FY16_9ACTN|nr:GntR family transcriptional regulator [Streptosporangium subroseum]SNS61645.1 transcriptional regulator, GntR family [Streptosporangium subroseum]